MLHNKALQIWFNFLWTEGLSQIWQMKMEGLHFKMLHC